MFDNLYDLYVEQPAYIFIVYGGSEFFMSGFSCNKPLPACILNIYGRGGANDRELFNLLQERIAHNLNVIRGRMADAARRVGRDPASVRLVAVTKTVGVAEIAILHSLGVLDIGENRIESAQSKIAALPTDIRWHFIAPIQSRKAKDVVALFSIAEAVDRVKVAETLQRRCEAQNRILEIMIEVNVTGEASKHGFAPVALPEVLKDIRAFDRLRLAGLMTMAPFDAPEPVIRDCFRGLNALANEHGLPERSMGMTDDFEIAIEEGATQVRIGRALFE